MYRSSVLFLVLALWMPPAFAQETETEPAKSQAQQAAETSLKEQYEALVDEFSAAREKFTLEYRQATTDKQRQKVLQELYPRPEKFADRFLKLASDHPEDPVAVDALVWILSNVRSGPTIAQATAILAEHHLDDKRLGQVALTLIYTQAAGTEGFLRKLLEESPHEDVRGKACYALTKYLNSSAQILRQIADRPELAQYVERQFGKEFAKRLASSDEDAIKEEVEILFQRVVDEFGDVASGRGATLGDVAGRDLFEIQHLAIGQIAPEIEGEDVDGVHFKLSDYRGKVVALDFWGNW